jgi:hypothetical protein
MSLADVNDRKKKGCTKRAEISHEILKIFGFNVTNGDS